MILSDEELAIYDLAFHLGKTVEQVYAMSYTEFLGWQDYLSRRPIGWRDDDRAAKIVQAQGVKEKATDLFPALKAIYGDLSATNAEGTNMNTLKGSKLFNWMAQAVGGDEVKL